VKQTCSKAVLFIAAFFVFVALTSCGIPTILYLDSDDYTFNTGTTTNTEVSISSLVVTTTSNYEDYAGVGPAVMFFYTIGKSDEINSFASGSTVESAFANKYIPTITQGRPITSNEVVSFTLNGKQRTLYAFRGADGQDFRAQQYMLASNSGLFAELTDAKLTYDDDTSSGFFSLSFDSSSSYQLSVGANLYRYKDNNLTFHNVTSFTDDFSAVSSDPIIYIYAAFCISPDYYDSSGTSFNNIFWSPLKYLGYIKLNQST
jgi:hypothetical protein